MVRRPEHPGWRQTPPEYTGAPEPPALGRPPAEWEQEQPSSLPTEERQDPNPAVPPPRQPDPEPQG
ncbi:MAG: hypothetical protein L6E13_09460 [Firmicutes bacterium]|nr:hypothetical protein [Bacillota bacterium]